LGITARPRGPEPERRRGERRGPDEPQHVTGRGHAERERAEHRDDRGAEHGEACRADARCTARVVGPKPQVGDRGDRQREQDHVAGNFATIRRIEVHPELVANGDHERHEQAQQEHVAAVGAGGPARRRRPHGGDGAQEAVANGDRAGARPGTSHEPDRPGGGEEREADDRVTHRGARRRAGLGERNDDDPGDGDGA
jgi:hypothetical protein